MRRHLALFLVLAMLLTFLTACGGNNKPGNTGDKDNTPGNSDNSGNGGTPGNTDPVVDRKDSWLCDEKTTLTVLTYDGVNSNFPPPSNDLPFWQWMEDYTNVHIEWEVASYTGYRDIITARLAGGADLPDIVMLYKIDIANDAGANGLVVDLSQYWDTCFTNIQSYFNERGTNYKAALTNEDGSCYGIATYATPIENHIVLLYNKLWMDQLNAKIPETLDEFTALLEKMKAAGDLNGNGENDEIYFTAAEVDHVRSIINNTFGLEQYQSEAAYSADKNGVVYDQYTTENMKASLAYLNKLYKSGLLDPEITTMSYDTLSEKVASDRVGVFACYSGFSTSYGKLTSAGLEDPNGEWYTLGGPLTSEWCEKGFFVQNESFNSMLTGISAKSKNVELAARWLDTLYADPNALITRTRGFEGETYEYDADGNIQLIVPEDGSAWNINKLGCSQIALPYVQTADQVMGARVITSPWYAEQYANLRENYEWRTHTITQVAAFTDYENSLRDLYNTDVETCWKEYRDKFIIGELNVETDWDAFVKTINAMGLESMIKVYQSVYDRTK